MTTDAGPLGIAGVPSVPHGHTAHRLEWKFLPREVRALIEDELGSSVVASTSQTSGFTPGFASVLTGANGRRAFVKAASRVAQAAIAESYAEEIRKLTLLGDGVPSPRLEWFSRDQSWVLLGFEAVDSHQPRRPWRPAELGRALDLAETIVETTRSIPNGLDLQPLYVDLPEFLTGWGAVADGWPHRDEAAALAAGFADIPDTGHFVHADLRDDNILLTGDGRALACDWNWPALGTDWQDSVDLLISAHGDGLDVEPILAARPLTRNVDPEQIDSWLAAVCGFMLAASQRPAPLNSPHVRTHNRWTAEAAWSWLVSRRGWSV